MGMDVIGKAPSSAKGKVFLLNNSYWPPLWTYCRAVSEHARSVRGGRGYTNDGDGLDGTEATQLAHTLKREIKNGNLDEFIDAQAAMPDNGWDFPLSRESVVHFAEFLEHCGGFEIW